MKWKVSIALCLFVLAGCAPHTGFHTDGAVYGHNPDCTCGACEKTRQSSSYTPPEVAGCERDDLYATKHIAILEEPSLKAKKVSALSKGERVFRLSTVGEWVRITQDTGWCHKGAVDSFHAWVKAENLVPWEKYKALKKQRKEAAKYWRPKLGMSKSEVIAKIGRPRDIHTSKGEWGKHEQWVYDQGNYKYLYIYFENGVCTAWQD